MKNSTQNISLDLFELKNVVMSSTEVSTSCFSREEFNSDLFELKGAVK